MDKQYIAASFAIAITVALVIGVVIGATITKPEDSIIIEEGLTPLNIYPTPFEGWHITVSYGGHHNVNTEEQWDWYQATKNGILVEAPTLYELAKKIIETQG